MSRLPVLLVLLVLVLAGCSAAPSPAGPGRSAGASPPQATAAPTARAPTAAAPSVSSPPAEPEPLPAYVASVHPIGSALRDRMRFSHRPGCPLRWSDLRLLRMSIVGFDGTADVGEMVIHSKHATAVTEVFEQLYEARWPIRRMRLVDAYQGDDDRSMAANNTSGYNCRRVAGSDSWSTHAYGEAIDVNPVQNPHVTATSVAPAGGRRFATVDRTARAAVPAGVITEADVVVRAFARAGWQWGGHWTSSKDYQHFSASGR